ncbi:MAG: hypothetical protein KIT84_12610 [Labilithrix sp.]|nr:hypothetical protein [Labilithrix sp.]MCW5811856.1 hypothetical protein [Labilithrix sp.]
MRARVWCIAVVAAMGCGTSEPPGSTGASSSSGGSIGGKSSSSSGTTPSDDNCSDAARLVYVLSSDTTLYSFAPNAGKFTNVGQLDCAIGAGVTPNSMAIDRQGTAWINYTDGRLFKASTENAHCEPTEFQPNQVGFFKFGMAFATSGPGSTTETLFISGLGDLAAVGKGFGKINLDTMKITMLGDFSGALSGRGAELTGTGDGKLFGFFTTSPNATFAEVKPSNGDTSNDVVLNGVQTQNSWAFSFWGGDFWFYTAAATGTSTVTRLKTSSDDSLSVVVPDAGFRIVGAGVSTCAPVEPPK